MSLFCIALVIVGTAQFCHPPSVDEGAAAHIFQLLMAAQVPMVLFYVASKGAKPLLTVLPVVALVLCAWGVAFIAVSRLT